MMMMTMMMTMTVVKTGSDTDKFLKFEIELSSLYILSISSVRCSAFVIDMMFKDKMGFLEQLFNETIMCDCSQEIDQELSLIFSR